MSNLLDRRQLGENLWFSSISDPKFKLNRISVNLVVPLREETAAQYAAVPFILRRGFRDCPDFTRLNALLCDLYGASLEADVRKYGGWQILNLSVQGIDDRFALHGEDISGRCADLLCSILLDPKWEGENLNEQDVLLEKQNLIDAIEADINDKRSYALSQGIAKMCAGEPNAVRKYGTVDEAEKITPQSAGQAYREILDTARVEVLFIGCGSPDSARELFARRFADRCPTKALQPFSKGKAKAEEVREYVERMDVTQAKLVLGFRTGLPETREQQAAFQLMNAILGGSPFSRLFVYVREKQSLCYYCPSRYDKASGIMTVDCGIEEQNKEAAQKGVLEQIKVMQEGGFTDEEFTSAKLSLRGAYLSVGDALSSQEGYYLSQILSGRLSTPEQDLERLEQLTREQVTEAARGVTLDTVYLLTGAEEEKA